MLMNSFCAYKGEHNIVSILGGAGCCRGFLLVMFLLSLWYHQFIDGNSLNSLISYSFLFPCHTVRQPSDFYGKILIGNCYSITCIAGVAGQAAIETQGHL